MKIIAFVGRSNSGKTILLEKLIPMINDRGFQVGVIKHTSGKYSLDTEGKDTHRHGEAGAKSVVFATPGGFALFHYEPWDLEKISQLMPDVDLVLVEGHRAGGPWPKILVHRTGLGEPPEIARPQDVIAFIGEPIPQEYIGIPNFEPSDLNGIANFILEHRQA